MCENLHNWNTIQKEIGRLEEENHKSEHNDNNKFLFCVFVRRELKRWSFVEKVFVEKV